MLRIVLLPQPEGPSRATNSPSLMRNEASSTATTSRSPSLPEARNPLRSLSISMRQRAAAALGGILAMRRLEEPVVDGVLHLDRLQAGQLAVPDLLAARPGVGLDQAVPVGDILELADLEQVGLARGRADKALDGAQDVLRAVGLDPLHRAPSGVGEGLDLLRLLVDRRGEAEVGVDRDRAADHRVPGLLLARRVDHLAPAVLLGLGRHRDGARQHVDLLGLQRAQHGVDIADADPGHLVGEAHTSHEIVRPQVRGAAERGDAEDRLLAVGPLPGGEFLHRIDALIVEILADGEAHAGRALVERVERAGRPAVLVELQDVLDVGDREVALARGEDLARLHAGAALDQLELVALVLEEALLLGDELDLVGRYRHRIDARAGLALGPCAERGHAGRRRRHADDFAAPDHKSHAYAPLVVSPRTAALAGQFVRATPSSFATGDNRRYCCCCCSWPQPFFSASKKEAKTLRMVLSAMSRVMNTTRLLRSSPSGQASSVAGGWKTCCTPWITTGLSVSLTFRMPFMRNRSGPR